ncbi:MAG: AAA-associated domain-containing protein [Thermoplasmata archaeon]
MADIIDPNARIADLVGLLYVMNNIFDGKTDLYQLEKEMEVDIDDLMPIVYTASNLGFIFAEEGDITITEKGREYVKAGIKRRKDMLRESLKEVEPFKTAIKAGEFESKDLLEALENNGVQTFNSPYGLHDLEVILIEWGIYSGLLKKTDEGYVIQK